MKGNKSKGITPRVRKRSQTIKKGGKHKSDLVFAALCIPAKSDIASLSAVPACSEHKQVFMEKAFAHLSAIRRSDCKRFVYPRFIYKRFVVRHPDLTHL